MTTLTLKDFLPLIGTVLTLVTGYVLISVQTNKNRKVKWIEDFRKEIGNFFAIATSFSKNPESDKKFEMLKSVATLTLYLFDSKKAPRRELISALREFQRVILEKNGVIETDEDLGNYGERLGHIMKYATQIILDEQAKI